MARAASRGTKKQKKTSTADTSGNKNKSQNEKTVRPSKKRRNSGHDYDDTSHVDGGGTQKKQKNSKTGKGCKDKKKGKGSKGEKGRRDRDNDEEGEESATESEHSSDVVDNDQQELVESDDGNVVGKEGNKKRDVGTKDKTEDAIKHLLEEQSSSEEEEENDEDDENEEKVVAPSNNVAFSTKVTEKSRKVKIKDRPSDSNEPYSNEVIKDMVRKRNGVNTTEKLKANAYIAFIREQLTTVGKQKIKTETLTLGSGSWSEELNVNLETTVRNIVSTLAWKKYFYATKKVRKSKG